MCSVCIQIPFEAGILEGLRRLSPEELSRLGPELVDGFICNTYTLECMKYLPWLLNRHVGIYVNDMHICDILTARLNIYQIVDSNTTLLG